MLPPVFKEALARCAQIFSELNNEDKALLKLISRRSNTMHNSWLHNLAKFKRGENLDNALFLSPLDAKERGFENGDTVKVFNTHGSIEARVRVDDTLRSRVVAMTHGWENERSPGVKVANKYPGVNANVLLASGKGSFEKLSNMTFMTGIPVSVERLSSNA